ncbi:GGDEF domain-containing protein [Marinomonas piezotolerans]|uniref:diguanylate cyclase n=1 Tax=Marinomonas piezotolerans TaxID=2213058 RepID=A0A370U6H3_9GAMM|nr:GGDEF domain-containing protein [Marinomonas piezotolerans]RDL43353.1 GGDEF domain-containing protein [Marinomonas piezotolerans]
MDSTQEKLVESLRKALSRVSMLAEGNNPELDAILQNIRANLSKADDPRVVQSALKTIEPYILKFDDERLERAQAFRNALHEMMDSLEGLPDKQLPLSEKKALEADIRAHWQSVSNWPSLLAKTTILIQTTLASPPKEPKKNIFTRILGGRKAGKQSDGPTSPEIMAHVSHTLAGLLTNIALSDEYEEQILDLKNALTGNQDLNQLPGLLDEVINLILIAVGKTQEDLTSYLSQLNKQLASINASIVNNYKVQKNISTGRKSFGDELKQHVVNTHSDVNNATDLDALKSLISDRMNTITETMTRYQSKMIEQEKHAAQSISLLRSKVNRMEKDASSLRNDIQQKIAQAMSDTLTGLPNRAAYQDAIFPLLTAASQSKQPLCMAICDIDYFKMINDNWGHLAGDKVLRIIPQQMQNTLKSGHLLFRYGGEEFVILFPMSTIDQAYETCQKIRQAIEVTPFNMNGEPVSITISIGVSLFDGKESHDELFDRADKNLYQAKADGRNTVIRDI